jgi:hypothetical protein
VVAPVRVPTRPQPRPPVASLPVTANDLAEPIEAIPVETTAVSPLTTIIAWAAVVVALFGITFWVWTRWIDPPVGSTIDRYVNGGGVVFESPAAEFRVTMPTKYETSTGTNPWGQIVAVSDNPGGGYGFSVTKTPQPASALESYDVALNRLAGQMAADRNAAIVHQIPPTPLGGIGYKDLVIKKGNIYWRVQLELVTDRLYTVIARTPNSDPAPYQRLTKSFQILGPQ